MKNATLNCWYSSMKMKCCHLCVTSIRCSSLGEQYAKLLQIENARCVCELDEPWRRDILLLHWYNMLCIGLSPTGSFRAYTFWTLSEARSRLYQRRFLRSRAHFSAFFKLYIFSFAPFQISVMFQDLCTIFCKISRNFCWFSQEPADFAFFVKTPRNFFGISQNFSEFLKGWCQHSHIPEKSEKVCWILQNSDAKLRKYVWKKCVL